MTHAEARIKAKEILLSLAELADQLSASNQRVLTQLSDLLDEAYASHIGVTAIDKPLGIPWSTISMKLFELLRWEYLPDVAATLPLTNTQLSERFGYTEPILPHEENQRERVPTEPACDPV